MKPPYTIPTMQEIAKVQGTNGYTVVSTFSGCGGACLGFEMDGYQVLYANEFVEAARDTYAANHPGVILDSRDIRTVTGEDILNQIGMERGEVDVLEGSPPCASFSTAGAREKAWGRVKKYSDTTQRADDLFFEYSRILGEIQPKVFTAENVSGLIKGKAIGYFKEILADLRTQGYTVEAKVLDASWLGVPQARQRLIFIGVRNDIADEYGLRPVFPKPMPYQYTTRDVLETTGQVIHDTRGQFSQGDVTEKPVNTITTKPGHWYVTDEAGEITHDLETNIDLRIDRFVTGPERQCRKFTLRELRALASFPEDFTLTGNYSQRWERIGRSVPPLMSRAIAQTIRTHILDKIN